MNHEEAVLDVGQVVPRESRAARFLPAFIRIGWGAPGSGQAGAAFHAAMRDRDDTPLIKDTNTNNSDNKQVHEGRADLLAGAGCRGWPHRRGGCPAQTCTHTRTHTHTHTHTSAFG